MGKLDNLLVLADAEIGYTEKDNDKDLYPKVGPTAGTGNHTKYAHELEAIGLPAYCGQAWCGSYQMWLQVKTVGKDQALKDLGPKFYNCFDTRDWAKKNGKWIPNTGTPEAGYVVIFTKSHMARVTKVTANYIYTNEGNTNNGTAIVRNGGMVCEKKYARTNEGISGYVVVKFKEEELAIGWIKDNNGWWYNLGDNKFYRNEWKEINGKWYVFDGKGYAISGWFQDEKNRWFYMDESCAMVTGTRVIDGRAYSFDKDGVMLVGASGGKSVTVKVLIDENGVIIG